MKTLPRMKTVDILNEFEDIPHQQGPQGVTINSGAKTLRDQSELRRSRKVINKKDNSRNSDMTDNQALVSGLFIKSTWFLYTLLVFVIRVVLVFAEL